MNSKKFTIMARPYGLIKRVEICGCDSNPQNLVEAVRQMTIKIQGKGKKKVTIGKNDSAYFVENEPTQGGQPMAKK